MNEADKKARETEEREKLRKTGKTERDEEIGVQEM